MSLSDSWKPPKWAQAMSVADRAAVRQKYHIIVEGENLPPPLRSFAVCDSRIFWLWQWVCVLGVYGMNLPRMLLWYRSHTDMRCLRPRGSRP